VDLATNILYLLDCPIPKYMDGVLWTDALTPNTLALHPPYYSDNKVPKAQSQIERDPEQEAELQRRLKGLGYLN
jgi:hypothetical protein